MFRKPVRSVTSKKAGNSGRETRKEVPPCLKGQSILPAILLPPDGPHHLPAGDHAGGDKVLSRTATLCTLQASTEKYLWQRHSHLDAGHGRECPRNRHIPGRFRPAQTAVRLLHFDTIPTGSPNFGDVLAPAQPRNSGRARISKDLPWDLLLRRFPKTARPNRRRSGRLHHGHESQTP